FSRAKRARSRLSGSATTTTSPPRPPSPPSGPPFGTCFSRRKLSSPWPPRPAWTRIRARSWNIRTLGAACGAVIRTCGFPARPSEMTGRQKRFHRSVLLCNSLLQGARRLGRSVGGAEAVALADDVQRPPLDLLVDPRDVQPHRPG